MEITRRGDVHVQFSTRQVLFSIITKPHEISIQVNLLHASQNLCRHVGNKVLF